MGDVISLVNLQQDKIPGPKPLVVRGKAFQSSLIEREKLSFQNLKSEPMVSVMVRMRKNSFG